MALDIKPTGDAQTLAKAFLGKGGIVIKSATYTGGSQASGTFSAGPLGISDGAILTSGAAVNALPPNNTGSKGTNLSLPGDPLCTQLAGGIGTFDAAKLQIVFTVLPGADGVSFDFIVGSEEYPESDDPTQLLPWSLLGPVQVGLPPTRGFGPQAPYEP